MAKDREREARASESELFAGELSPALHLAARSLGVAEVDQDVVGAVLGNVAQVTAELLCLFELLRPVGVAEVLPDAEPLGDPTPSLVGVLIGRPKLQKTARCWPRRCRVRPSEPVTVR